LKNLEYKARVGELNPIENSFVDKGAEFTGILRQLDTYFNVSSGRLKLRETEGRGAELIYYERDEASSAGMESRYDILRVPDPVLKGFLTRALGVRVIVEKERRLLKMKNARIHLDDVKRLGTFIEFEVVSGEGTPRFGDDEADRALLQLLKDYAAPFVVREINESYSDLMLKLGPAGN
jgi:adenylate cyclase, class 2